MWVILQDADFAPRKDRHLAWRLSASELDARAQAAMWCVEAQPAPKLVEALVVGTFFGPSRRPRDVHARVYLPRLPPAPHDRAE